jgi:outer membrane protein
MRCVVIVRLLFALGIVPAMLVAQNPPPALTLAQAEEMAVQHHPRIASREFTAQASQAAVNEARAAFFPTLSSNLTGVEAEHSSTLSAGALTTSSIYSRVALGVVASEMLTDFGRTSSLVQSAKLRNESQKQNIETVREQIRMEVRASYFAELAAASVLKVARATLGLRQVTLRQVTALARNSLRSTVDVSFAQVNVSQAQLDVLNAENNVRASHARLSAALGYEHEEPFSLVDEPMPPPLNPDVDALVTQALRERPDLAALRLNQESLDRYAEAEKGLRNPTISVAAAAGAAPARDPRLQETYAAAGVNVNIPILNGGLYKARRQEAAARAAAANKDLEDLSVEVARDVRVAWLNANDAFERLDVMDRLVAEAKEALRLSQARYDASLGSIVELSHAQLNQTTAEIGAAAARYTYLSRRAALDYAMGALR